MAAKWPGHLIRLLVALLKHQARTWLGEEFMKAAGDAVADIGGQELQAGLDRWLHDPQTARQLLEAARRAEEYVQAHCADPALSGALTLRFADLPAVQAALADLPAALDESGVERALREALARDMGRTLTPAQIEAATRLYTDALLRAVSSLKDFALPVIAQNVLSLREEHREQTAMLREILDQLGRGEVVRLGDNAPVLPPEIPRLPLLIGREAEKKALLDLYERVCRERKGLTVFLTGKTGSGRHALVQWMQDEVFRRGGYVAATCFWDPRRVEAETSRRLYWDTDAMKRYGQALAGAFPRASQLLSDPWLGVVAQLFRAAPHLPPPIDDPRVLNHFVRIASTERPLLLTVEYLHWADTAWIDLLRLLADEVAQDLPVLLLVTLDTPVPVEQLTARQHTEYTRLAETLVRQGMARTFHLGPVSAEDVARSLRINSGAAERLVYLAEGDAWVVYLLWEEWKRHGIVAQRADGTWEMRPTRESEWLVYGELRDHAHALLSGLLDTAPPPSFGFQEVEAILNCAALEGEVFTAQAVAEALEIDPDDLMDFLDDYLCGSAEETSDEGIVCEVGFVDLPRGPAFQYRFARPYLHHVFTKYPKREEDRRIWSGRLAEALERMHYPFTNQIADVLYRLFEAAGLRERAEIYRRAPILTPALETLRWQVHLLRATVTDEDAFGTYRLFDAGFQLCDLIATERPDLWEEGYEVAADLAERAARLGEYRRQADALYYAAWNLLNGGHPAEALPLAQESVRLYSGLSGFSTHLARVLNLQGGVLLALGDLAGARAALERALRIWEASLGPEHPQVATAVNNLGNVLQDLGDLAGARECFERALRIDEAAFGPDHPKVAIRVNNLGLVLQDLGDLAGARECFQRALRIFEQHLGEDHPNVATLVNNLGSVLQDLGDLARARVCFERALRIDEAAFGPDHPEVARDVNNLGGVLWALGDLAGARACFERSLGINEATLGHDHPRVAATLNNLGGVLQDLGDLAGARTCYERALRILRAKLPPDHPYIRTVEENLQRIIHE